MARALPFVMLLRRRLFGSAVLSSVCGEGKEEADVCVEMLKVGVALSLARLSYLTLRSAFQLPPGLTSVIEVADARLFTGA